MKRHKKLTYILLFIIIIAGISGCSTSTILIIENHNLTINEKDSYIVQVEESSTSASSVILNEQFIYINNEENLWMISETNNFYDQPCYDCEIYQEINSTVYEYCFQDKWLQIETDSRMEKVTNMDQILLDFFDIEKVRKSKDVLLKTTITLSDLDAEIIDFLNLSINEKYDEINLPLEAKYDHNLLYFTEIKLDLTPIQEQINLDNFTVDKEANWTVTFNYNYLTDSISVSAPDAVYDDYVNYIPSHDAPHEDINSYEIISGSINFLNDIDTLHIHFDESGSYQIKSLYSNTDIPIVVSLYTVNDELLKSFCLDVGLEHSSYTYLESGSYYLSITSPDLSIDNEYKLIFVQ